METKARGRQLARELISDDPQVVARAKEEIGKAPPVVTNAAARQLARFLAAGGDEATAVGDLLANTEAKWFGGAGYGKLMRVALFRQDRGGEIGAAAKKVASYTMRGPDQKYVEKRIAHQEPASSNLIMRILSVYRSLWVMLLFTPIAIGGVFLISQGGDPLGITAIVLAVFGLCVVIDARKRRCRKCGLRLGGERLGIVKKGRGNKFLWRCVGCKTRWSTTSY